MYYFLSEATSRLKIEVDNKIIESGGCLRELALYYYKTITMFTIDLIVLKCTRRDLDFNALMCKQSLTYVCELSCICAFVFYINASILHSCKHWLLLSQSLCIQCQKGISSL